MTRAVGYIRVSTDRQAEEGVSMDFQEEDIRKYCESKGYELTEMFRDAGYSGASKNRPDFQRMLRAIRQEVCDVVVCYKSDRLSRGLFPATALIEALDGTQIRMESVHDAIDINAFGLLAAVGKIELESIRQRTRSAARSRASRGKVTGVVAYGYIMDEDGFPIVDEIKAEVVRRIFDLYISGMSANAIAKLLNQEGIPGPSGGRWWDARVLGIIKDPKYAGASVWGQRQYTFKDNGDGRDVRLTHRQPKETWVDVPFPAIVDRQTFDEAQRRRKYQFKAKKAGSRELPPYLLKGKLWCGVHGRPYGTSVTPRPGNKVHCYYSCTSGLRPDLYGHCKPTKINARKLERRVLEYMREWLQDPERFQQLRDDYLNRLQEGGGLETVTKARKRLEEIEAERGRLVTAFQKSYINEAELDLKFKGLNEEREYHEEVLDRAQRETGDLQETLALLDKISSRLEEVRQQEWFGPLAGPVVAALSEGVVDYLRDEMYTNSVTDTPDATLLAMISRITHTGAPYPHDLEIVVNVRELAEIQQPRR